MAPDFPKEFKEKYEIGKQIGRGAFSDVYRVRQKSSMGLATKNFAVKIIEKSKVNGKNKDLTENIKKEIDIMKSLKHPHIVCIQEYIEGPKNIFIVMDLAEGGELFDRIISLGSYTEKDASRIIKQVLKACHYLHATKGVVHRDIKPENILFKTKKPDSEVMLSDFGLSYAAEYALNDVMSTACGTPGYCAPEVLKHRGKYTKKVDLWSVGVVCYILLCGYPPFSFNENDNVLFRQILKCQYQFDSPAWDNVSKEAKEFVSNLMTLDVESRLSAETALKHPWIQGKAGSVTLEHVKGNLEKTKAQARWKKVYNALRAFPPAPASSGQRSASVDIPLSSPRRESGKK